MTKVVGGMVMSLDGYISDRDGSGELLYSDFEGMMASEVMQESFKRTGAVVMGRTSYDGAEGDYTDYEYQVPIFVLTHHLPEQPAKGQNDKLKIRFVTDGVESAVAKAKAAAGSKDVTVVGGAETIRQLIKAGLIDELQVDIAPILLGGGTKLFEPFESEPIQLEQIKLVEYGGLTHFAFRVIKQ